MELVRGGVNRRRDNPPAYYLFRCEVDLHHRIIDKRVVSDALFYILPVHLTILIWMVMPAPYRYTGQVLYNLITEHSFRVTPYCL